MDLVCLPEMIFTGVRSLHSFLGCAFCAQQPGGLVIRRLYHLTVSSGGHTNRGPLTLSEHRDIKEPDIGSERSQPSMSLEEPLDFPV